MTEGTSSVESFTSLDDVKEFFPELIEVEDVQAVFWSGSITDRKLSLLDNQFVSVVGFSHNGARKVEERLQCSDIFIQVNEKIFAVKMQNFIGARDLLNELKVN